MKKHPHVKNIYYSPPQIVTDNLRVMEKEWKKENIVVTHIQRLTLDEVMEYVLDPDNVSS